MPLSADDFHPPLDRRQTGELARLIGELDNFKGHWRKLREIHPERLAALRQVTTIESVASSTRIEGAELSDVEVARVLQGIHFDSFRARDEEEVRGYADLLALIFESFEALSFTENHLKQLHGVMLKHSSRDARHRGAYKTLENHVVRKEDGAVVEILFRTATPFDTPRLMGELIEVTNDVLGARAIHPLVAIGRFVVDLLAIHPFQDGNGRVARALTTLLLLRAGYDYVPYASLERIIEDNKAEYYEALRASQIAMRGDPSAFGAWLLFFLRALRAQQRALDAKLHIERGMMQLSATQQRIAELVVAHGRLTAPAIGTALQLATRTVRDNLKILTDRGVLAAHGEKKGRYYTSTVTRS
jgi:Fic family protein